MTEHPLRSRSNVVALSAAVDRAPPPPEPSREAIRAARRLDYWYANGVAELERLNASPGVIALFAELAKVLRRETAEAAEDLE